MADKTSESPRNNIRYADYKEEMNLRMRLYPSQLDLITLFTNAYQLYKEQFDNAVEALQLSIFDGEGNFNNVQGITLAQVEDIARKMNSCGYEFLEAGEPPGDHKFYTHLPIRYQPYLDELFESSFHRELETVQYCIDDFIEEAQLNIEELNAMDLGEKDVTLSYAEKIAQGFYMPAFEMIKHEYILHVATKIREYNPHRTFHRLHTLNPEEKYKVLE